MAGFGVITEDLALNRIVGANIKGIIATHILDEDLGRSGVIRKPNHEIGLLRALDKSVPLFRRFGAPLCGGVRLAGGVGGFKASLVRFPSGPSGESS